MPKSRIFTKSLPWASSSKLTQAGTVIGTPAYMSPEQALGTETDHRTDIYSLGIMLYEMACGEVPFTAENPLAVLSMQVSEAPRSLSRRLPAGELPEGYEAVIMKCLAKHPSDRFQSMQELKDALGALSSGLVPEVTPPRQSWRPSINTPHLAAVAFGVPAPLSDEDIPFARRPNPRWLRLAGGVGLGALAAAGFFAMRSPAAPPVAPAAAVVVAPPPPAAPAPVATSPAPAPAEQLTEVHVILFPLDARAYDGTKDLGMMPITVKLKPGEKKILTVSRRGYATRSVTIDGSSTRVVAGLVVEGAKDPHQAQKAADLAASKNADEVKRAPRRPATMAGNPYDDNPY